MSRRLPATTSRCTQDFDPPGAMFRYNVEDGPSPYRPDFESERTIATVNRPTVRAVLARVYGLYWAFLEPIETAG